MQSINYFKNELKNFVILQNLAKDLSNVYPMDNINLQVCSFRINQVELFLCSLSETDRFIFESIYIYNNRSFESVALKCYMSKSTLQRTINKTIQNYMEDTLLLA